MKGNTILNSYLLDPELYPEQVVFYDENVSIIYDKYPKSAVHFLVLPRSGDITWLSPFQILSDQMILDTLSSYVERAKLFAAMQLRAVKEDTERPKNFPVDVTPELQQEFRPYLDRIKAGFHALPSLGNSHIHVISRDNFSRALKHANHYNSFTTAFFVPFNSKADTAMSLVGRDEIYKLLSVNDLGPMNCHTCGQEFTEMRNLKPHLEQEFLAWKNS